MIYFSFLYKPLQDGLRPIDSKVLLKLIQLFEISQVVAFGEEEVLGNGAPPHKILQAPL